MKTILRYMTLRTRIDMVMLTLAMGAASYFVFVALSILNGDNGVTVAAIVMLLFAGIFVDVALFAYRRGVLPGLLDAALNAAHAMQCEKRFIDACDLIPGDVFPTVAARMGLAHILRAFKRAATATQ